MIKQGDVFWVELGEPHGSEPGYRHPYVIVQNDIFNASRVNTTIGMALSSNLSRAKVPGNVLLNKGEANLAKTSVVIVSQIITIDKTDLKEKIGRLTTARVEAILTGLRLVTEPREI